MSLEPLTTLACAQQLRRLDRVEATQRELFARILTDSVGSAVARELGVHARTPLDEFLSVGPRDSAFYERYAEQALDGDRHTFSREPVIAFAQTSGSTGKPKLIPHTESSLRCFERFTQRVLLFQLKEGRHYIPHRTKWLLVTASTAVHMERGVPVGFISGLMYQRAQRTRRGFVLPSPDVAAIDDWQLRIHRAVTEAKGQRVGTLLGVPAYLIRFLEEAANQFGGDNLSSVWPMLGRVYYSGTSIESYRASLERALGRSIVVRGLYSATEGAFGAELDADRPGELRLMTDLAVFSFRDAASGGALRGAWQLEPSRQYEAFITTRSGMMQYAIGDVIEVTSVRPLRFRVAGRVGEELNLATEKLSVKQACQVMARVATRAPLSAQRFMVVPDRSETRRHLWIVEQTADVEPVRAAQLIDSELAAINPSYAALRSGDAMLRPPRVLCLAPGAFDAYVHAGLTMRGQFKFRHVLPDSRVLRETPGLADVAARAEIG